MVVETARVARARPLYRVARLHVAFRRWPIIPVLILAIVAVAGAFAPLLAPHPARTGYLGDRAMPPMWMAEGSSKYVFGTDHLGRDILSRLIFGARVSLLIATIAISSGAFIGSVLGLISGYAGGWTDETIMRLVDLMMSIPMILIALVMVVTFGASFTILLIIMGLFTWSGFARIVRGETLSLKNRDYVSLAKVAGASSIRILFRHLFPGVVNTIVVMATLRVGSLILMEAILSFLGAGVPPPDPSWGSMCADGRDFISTAWWQTFFPGMAIFVTVLSMNFLGDWMRDRFDPKLRQL